MSSPRSTRGFVRGFSILALLAVLVVGLAGLVALWLSTSGSRAVTDRTVAGLTLAGLILLVLTVVAVVGALASQVLVAPMLELTSVVERLRRGEPDARARTDHGSAEVASIAVQVNALAEEVETWRTVQAESDRLRRTFSEISRTVREELDFEAVFDVPAMVGPALAADRCWLRLARGERFEDVVRQWHRDDLEPLEDIPLAGDDPYDAALRLWSREEAMSRPDLTARLDLEPLDLQLFVAATGVRSILVVPIGAGENVLGLLTWAMTDRPRAWTSAEVAAAQRVAADLGRAIVHASLYEQQLEIVAQLRDIDRRKNDFLSTVSHELRTPLTSIIGYLELVLGGTAGEVPEPMRTMLDVVDGNAIRLRALIEDLLVLARIEDGSLRPSSEPVDVAQVIEHAAQTVRPEAEDGGVDLFVDAGPRHLKVIGDARHLDLAALNIISNAVKFTPSGGRVTVVVRYDADTHEVLLTCSDSGIGIPERDQAGLFDRFFRASNATSHAIPGTGLGLSVIKGIVDAHGGAVALTSREGKGTIVTVRLPGATLEAAEPAEAQTAR
jgi:two-component system phosphate regulon sensor histidine kinase PhoR